MISSFLKNQELMYQLYRPVRRAYLRVRDTLKPKQRPHGSGALASYERRVCSQNGEDGIVAEIFKRIGTEDPFFVEIGVEDGIECNTAYLARFKSWRGLMVEGDPIKAERLRRWYADCAGVKSTQRFVTRDNVNAILAEFGVAPEFDLLSIDIDGNDYYIWETTAEAYRPRVVIVEMNASYPPPLHWVMPYDPEHGWDGSSYYGASLAAFEALGAKLGYALLGTDSRSVNAFFLRNDLVERAGFTPVTLREAFAYPKGGTRYFLERFKA